MSKQTKPITIITTIQPPDAKGRRKITVAAAPDKEMPAVFTGLFADWHKLEAEAYVAVSTRAAQTVKAKNGSKPAKVTKKKRAAKKPDQLVRTEDDTSGTAAANSDDVLDYTPKPVEELPIIEGDEITPPP